MAELSAFNETKQAPLAVRVRLAAGVWSRFWGLMGRPNLPEDEGLLLSPCSSVHTAFMRFPIDVVFVDRDGVVVKIAERLRPFRASVARGARSALELPAGNSARLGLSVGDRLRFSQREDGR